MEESSRLGQQGKGESDVVQNVNAPGQINPPTHPEAEGEREWSDHMLSCKPWDLCCVACWCPCILYGRTHERLQDPSMKNYSTVNKYCMRQGALQFLGFAWLLPMFARADMRHRYGLKGSEMGDFARACCCGGMILLQQEKEAMKVEIEALQPNVDGYQSQHGMTYPA